MDKNNTLEEFEKDLKAFAEKWGVVKLMVETRNLKRNYQGETPFELALHKEVAVVRVLGRTQRVLIGEDQKYKTYEEAAEGVRAYWSNYFKERRRNMTPKERSGYARRQKRYRERRKQERQAIERQQ